MGIDILSVTPHQVSRDMRGYSVFFYGEPKSGKTTIATKFPNHLLLAFEKGYNAIPGAMAQPINSWAEFLKVIQQLTKDEAKQKFETIIIDTADIAYDYCSTYICNNHGVDSVSDIPFGKGYGLIAKEFDTKLRKIVQLGYGLVIISHETDKTFTDVNGQQYNKIVPTLDKRANNIVARMCDIIGYARIIADQNGTETTKLFMRGTPRFEAGSRFKYTPDFIDFSYSNLVNAIGDAIDKQAAEEGSEHFTEERETSNTDTTTELDFDALFEEAMNIIKECSSNEEKMESYYAPRITEIVAIYLGKNNKLSEIRRDQKEQLSLIVDDLKNLVATE